MRKARKIKNIKVNAESVLSIPKEFIESCKFQLIIELLKEFNEANKIEEQIEITRSLSTFIKNGFSETSETVISILAYLFLHSNSRSPIKRSILRIFANATNVRTELATELSKQLLVIIKNIKDPEYSFINHTVSSINDCFDNCLPAAEAVANILKEVIEFLINYFDLFVQKLTKPNQDLLQNVHNITRAIVSVFQKMNVDSLIANHLPVIFHCCGKTLNDPNVSFDTKNNCGIILAISANSTKNGYIDLLQSCLERNFQKWGIDENYDNIDLNISCILSGILNVIYFDKLSEYNKMFGSSMLFIICKKMYELSKSAMKNPDIIISINRTLLLASRSLELLPEQELEDILTILLDHSWIHLEHYIDTVRHIAKSIFINLVKLSAVKRSKGYEVAHKQILKSLLSLSELRSTRYIGLSVIASEIGFADLLETKRELIDELLEKLQDATMCTYVIICCENLMRYHLKEVSEEFWTNTWILPLTRKITESDSYTENEYKYQHLLTVAIKLKPTILNKILSQWSINNETHLISLLKCSVIARRIGATVTEKTENDKWRNLIDYSVLELAMCHQNNEVRLTSLALIAESLKSTELFTKEEFKFILKFLHYNINTQLPATRQQILSLMKKILIRFNEGYYAVVRDLSKLEEAPANNAKLMYLKEQKYDSENFIFSLHKCIFDNIFPGANVSRRIISLEILTLMQPIVADVLKKANMSDKELWTGYNVETLLLCLSDSYESNKKLAANLLATCPIEDSSLNDCNKTKQNIKDALNMATSVRPTETISAAYILESYGYSPKLQKVLFDLLDLTCSDKYENEYLMIRLLLNQLQSQVQVAKKSLWKAAGSAPMQGTVFCIRHLMEKYIKRCKIDNNWKVLIADIIQTCIDVMTVVGIVVNNASPEGHLPDYTETDHEVELFNTDGLNSVTPQMLLVCCWRSVKEVSLLLGDLSVNSLVQTCSQPGLITEQELINIGEHFTRSLTEIKHRGAFEQAYIGFSKLCTCLWNCELESLHQLPQLWLKDILDAIEGRQNSLKSKLCTTRRSAGLPFMVQAIVTAELQTGQKKNFHFCMQTLLTYAKSDGDNIEMRTHSKNVLRALYRHAQLGEVVTPYLTDGLKIAILSFKKKAFAERNSATLLFASLMTRIFGVQRQQDVENLNIRNRMIARVFFMRYPTIHTFLMEELRAIVSKDYSVFEETALLAIIMILVRLYSAGPDDEESNMQLQSFVPHVKKCCGLGNFMIRKQAALVMSEIIPVSHRNVYIKELFSEIISNKFDNENYLHGNLLQISYFLKSNNTEEIFAIAYNIFTITHVMCCLNTNRSALTAALYMQIVLKLFPNYENKELLSHNLESLLHMIQLQDKYIEDNIKIGKSKYQSSATNLQLCILHLLYQNDYSHICNALFDNLKHDSVDVRLFTLNVLIYLYNDKADSALLEIWEIPDAEKLFVETLSPDYREGLIAYLNNNWREMTSSFGTYLSINDDSTSRAFAMLSNFPKAVLEIARRFSPDVFNYYVEKSESDDESMLCASLSCIRSLFIALQGQDISQYNLGNVYNMLHECSFTTCDVSCRYCVVLILTEHHQLITGVSDIVNVENLCTLWSVVMQLLDDPEIYVRNRISKLTLKLKNNSSSILIAEKAREELLTICVDYVKNVSRDKCIALLLYWALIDRDHSTDDEDLDGPVYEQGEVNTYVESIYLNILSAKMLRDFFHFENQTGASKMFEEIKNIMHNNEICWNPENHEIEQFLNIINEIQAKQIFLDVCCTQVLTQYFNSKEESNYFNNLDLRSKYKISNILKNLLHVQ